MSDPATIAFYQANAPRYTSKFGLTPSRHLEEFLDRLSTEADILELGCGGGEGADGVQCDWFAVTVQKGVE